MANIKIYKSTITHFALVLIVSEILSSSAADAHGMNASVVDETPSPVRRLATTSLVVRKPVVDGSGGGGKKDEP